MMEKYGQLFESIFKRELTDSSTVSYLENLTQEHPYFSVAQFYLLRLSPKNENGYKNQAKKTAVLFNNNHWLNFQLLNAGFPANDAAASADTNQYDKVFDDHNREILEKITGEDHAPAFAVPVIEAVEEMPADHNIPKEETAAPVDTESETVTPGEVIPVEIPVEETMLSAAEETANHIQPAGTQQANEIPGAQQAPVITNETTLPVIEETTAPAEEINDAAVAADQATNENEIQPEITAGGMPQERLHEETAAAEPGTETLASTASATETAPTAEPLLFEPLHTTDYFASVGIKLTEEEKNAGSLGKQLKSFTEWLKTMKKVHSNQQSHISTAAEVNLSATESTIQKMAENSNVEGDIITEAMAEVLLQQGKKEKAVEILEKLSLLNPGKSTYFAAKINQIKEK